MSSAGHRNARIDALRFLFSLIIVLHHTRYLLGYEHAIFAGGSLAVEFFFFVSGYLMMASAVRAGKKASLPADCGTGTAPGKETALSTETALGTETAPGTETALSKETALGTETAQFLRRKIAGILPEFVTAWFVGFFFISAVRHYGPRAMAGLFVRDFFELTLVKMSGLFVGGFDGVIWYVSAMFLVMAVLYPLIRRFPDFFPKIGAPLMALFLLGYLCQSQGSPRDPAVWLGLCFKGIIRTAADLCIGIVCWQIAEKIRRTDWTMAGRILLTLLEPACYLAAIWYMYTRLPSKQDYFFLMLFAAAVTLSFADVPGAARAGGGRTGRVTSWLARYSTALYFSHLYYATNLNRILPADLGSAQRVAVYLACAMGTALGVMYFAAFLRAHKRGMIRAFVKSK